MWSVVMKRKTNIFQNLVQNKCDKFLEIYSLLDLYIFENKLMKS